MFWGYGGRAADSPTRSFDFFEGFFRFLGLGLPGQDLNPVPRLWPGHSLSSPRPPGTFFMPARIIFTFFQSLAKKRKTLHFLVFQPYRPHSAMFSLFFRFFRFFGFPNRNPWMLGQAPAAASPGLATPRFSSRKPEKQKNTKHLDFYKV